MFFSVFLSSTFQTFITISETYWTQNIILVNFPVLSMLVAQMVTVSPASSSYHCFKWLNVLFSYFFLFSVLWKHHSITGIDYWLFNDIIHTTRSASIIKLSLATLTIINTHSLCVTPFSDLPSPLLWKSFVLSNLLLLEILKPSLLTFCTGGWFSAPATPQSWLSDWLRNNVTRERPGWAGLRVMSLVMYQGKYQHCTTESNFCRLHESHKLSIYLP